MFIEHQKTLEQSLRNMLQAVNKEAQSLSTVSFLQISPLALGFLPLTWSKYLFAEKGIANKQTHAQRSNKNLRNNRRPKENG